MAKPFDDILKTGTMISDVECFECGNMSLKYGGTQTIEQNEKFPFVVHCVADGCSKSFYYDHQSKEYEEVSAY